ncbi:MAG: hypothetical protein ACR2J8_11845, partial [Thermomicrobiales bacterium]
TERGPSPDSGQDQDITKITIRVRSKPVKSSDKMSALTYWVETIAYGQTATSWQRFKKDDIVEVTGHPLITAYIGNQDGEAKAKVSIRLRGIESYSPMIMWVNGANEKDGESGDQPRGSRSSHNEPRYGSSRSRPQGRSQAADTDDFPF